MANNKKISQLADALTLQATDKLVIARNGVNYAVTGAQIIAAAGASQYADAEAPTGAVNGSNAAFGLAHTPSPVASLQLFLNGMLQRRGTDYTLTVNGITYAVAPQSGDNHYAFYRY